MGTWGAGPFENDDASDWVYDLELVSDLSVCRNTFLLVITEDKYLEQDRGAHTIAAAEVIAALAGARRRNLPAGVEAWLAAHAIVPDAEDHTLALSAIGRVLAPDSELRALWGEVADGVWESEVDDLQERLGRV